MRYEAISTNEANGLVSLAAEIARSGPPDSANRETQEWFDRLRVSWSLRIKDMADEVRVKERRRLLDLACKDPEMVSLAITDASKARAFLIALTAVWWGWGFDDRVRAEATWVPIGFVVREPVMEASW